MKIQQNKNNGPTIFMGALTIIIVFGIMLPVLSYKESLYVDAIVIFKDGASIQDTGINRLSRIIYKYRWDALNGFAAKMPYVIYKELEKSPFVKIICLDIKMVVIMNDNLDWGIDQINAERVWGGYEDAKDVLTGNVAGDGINVLVCDTGFKNTHPDLNDNWIDGFNWVDDREYNDFEDIEGHGTHCAGLIFAEDNEWGTIGVAPKAKLFGARVLDDNGFGDISDLIDVIFWASEPSERSSPYDEGNYPRMDVISMSFGWSPDDSYKDALNDICDYAYDRGVVLVAAAGNNPPLPIYELAIPAQFKSVISVGAVYQNNAKCSFSCYSPELDIVAPGYQINSTWLNNNFHIASGTSCACPLVAGVCALILSANSNLNPSQVAYCLYATSLNIDNTYSSEDDLYFGHGLIRANLAVELAENLDLFNPCVCITNPATTLVHDTVKIRVAACSDEEIQNVKFYINSVFKYDDTIGINGWTWDWNTNEIGNGEYNITCKTYDASGHCGEIQKIVQVLNGGGSGECPNLLVWNGENFVDEGVLAIHNENNSEEDVILSHLLHTTPFPLENNNYLLKLSEIAEGFNVSHSSINQVELLARGESGRWIKCPLLSAVHSTIGNVKNDLLNRDDKSVDTFKGDDILLEFQAFPKRNFIEYLFTIVGHNKFKV